MRGIGLRAAGAFVIGGSLAGCIIVTEPRPASQPARPGSHATPTQVQTTPKPAAPPPATQTAPPATSATTAKPATTGAPGPEGPRVTVNGREYVTLRSATAFGDGNNTPGSFPGFVYFLPSGTAQLPNLDATTPAGVLFAHGFNVRSNNYTQGFPGIDQSRNEWFGIRYEGQLVAAQQGEYTFKLTSDDGARLSIDSAPVVVNLTSGERTGHISLASGPHNFRLDYFQATGPVTLVLTVAGPGMAERVFSL